LKQKRTILPFYDSAENQVIALMDFKTIDDEDFELSDGEILYFSETFNTTKR